MRVMYISKLLDRSINDSAIQLPDMNIGDVFHVTDEFYYGNRHYYFLAEFPDDMAFRSHCFAILPDQPEEVIEELEEATA